MPDFVQPKPKIPGEDVGGIVVDVPKGGGSKFKKGDRVVAMMPILGTR
jgi:NADPH:quinone reductase-like Zn-dependent oxidoreductase